ncbi:YktB family protein [Paenibacillus sp. YIM B09110]|uniref:YktB family protein n=1 Tax=Paenibacillus sp. YIM B09110 TaxID=3126102 RepID=UPI00301C7BA7
MATKTTNGLIGFTQEDFDVFQLEGLEERMAGIQGLIQPKFQAIGERLAGELAVHAGDEMYLHIAKHARRTVNPPKDTWLSICNNKRGYKSHPHFQLGLFDDHLFLWLALIYEVPNKSQIAAAYLDKLDDVIAAVPDNYMISLDHTMKEATRTGDMSTEDWNKALVRFRDVKKAELLIGRHIPADDALLRSGDILLKFASSTFETLMPLYRMSLV